MSIRVFKLAPLRSPNFSTFQPVDYIDGKRTTYCCSPLERSLAGRREGQEGSSFARTAYVYLGRFVDNSDATCCTQWKRRYNTEYSKSLKKLFLISSLFVYPYNYRLNYSDAKLHLWIKLHVTIRIPRILRLVADASGFGYESSKLTNQRRDSFPPRDSFSPTEHYIYLVRDTFFIF